MCSYTARLFDYVGGLINCGAILKSWKYKPKVVYHVLTTFTCVLVGSTVKVVWKVESKVSMKTCAALVQNMDMALFGQSH